MHFITAATLSNKKAAKGMVLLRWSGVVPLRVHRSFVSILSLFSPLKIPEGIKSDVVHLR